MSVHVQTGNMLDVVIEGKDIGLQERISNHVIWLPEPEGLVSVLTAEMKRLGRSATPTTSAAIEAAKEIYQNFVSVTPETGWTGQHVRDAIAAIITNHLGCHLNAK